MAKKTPAQTKSSSAAGAALKQARAKGRKATGSKRKAGRPKSGKSSRKKGDTGKRYSPEEKKKIIEFVNSQGRGGISRACKKFKVSYIALRRWLEGAGVKAGNAKSARGGKADPKTLAGIQKATAEVKDLRKQLTALHKILRSLA